MRRYTVLLFGLLLLLVVPGSVLALTTKSGTDISSTETVKDVYAAGGNSITLTGTYENDVYVAGNTVTVSGPIGGDLFIGGGTASVSGEVKGSIRIAGGTVLLNSKVGKNVVLMGGTLTLGTTSDISGEVLAFGGTVVAGGRVAKDMTVWSGTVTITGMFDGNISVHTSSDEGSSALVTVGDTAVVKGTVTYWATRDASISPNAKISGTVTKNIVTSKEETIRSFFKGFTNLVRLWNLFSLLVVGLVLALLFPKTVRGIAEMMLKRNGASIGWGVLILFASPVAMVFFLVTVIGIPLSLLLLGIFVAGMYLSQVFLGYLVGETVLQRLRRNPAVEGAKPLSPVWPALLGIVIVWLVTDLLFGYLAGLNAGLAFLLGVIRLFLTLWPFGALVLVKWAYVREYEQKP
ncbi:MAG: polymer-forming cytoskeletal protein [Candidatus Kerfeldbacteria bacterium]